MIQHRLLFIVLGSVLVSFFFGCRSITPAVSYYTLRALTEEPAIGESKRTGPAPMIGIRHVTLPGSVNRTQMVKRTGSYKIKVASFHRWADYPDRMIHQLLREDLQTLLPEMHVVNAPWQVGLKPDTVLSFQFQELIGSTDNKMVLDALWTISAGKDASKILSYRTNLVRPIDGNGFDDLADAHSRVLAELSRKVAETLKDVHGW